MSKGVTTAILISATALVLSITLLILYFIKDGGKQGDRGPPGPTGPPGPDGGTQFKWNIVNLSLTGSETKITPASNTIYVLPTDTPSKHTIMVSKSDLFMPGTSITFNGSFNQNQIQINSVPNGYKNPNNTNMTLTLYKHDCVTFTLSNNPNYQDVLYRVVSEVDSSNY